MEGVLSSDTFTVEKICKYYGNFVQFNKCGQLKLNGTRNENENQIHKYCTVCIVNQYFCP
jgi:hypothetical protein